MPATVSIQDCLDGTGYRWSTPRQVRGSRLHQRPVRRHRDRDPVPRRTLADQRRPGAPGPAVLTGRRLARFGVLTAGLAVVLTGTLTGSAAAATPAPSARPPRRPATAGTARAAVAPATRWSRQRWRRQWRRRWWWRPVHRDGEAVPCYDDLLGWFNSSDGCYYKVAEPQPAGVPEGRTSYLVSCAGGLAGGEPVVLDDPPPGFGAPPDPADLAARALASLNLRPAGRRHRTGPRARARAWSDCRSGSGCRCRVRPGRLKETWGPLTATESDRGVTVNLIAAKVEQDRLEHGRRQRGSPAPTQVRRTPDSDDKTHRPADTPATRSRAANDGYKVNAITTGRSPGRARWRARPIPDVTRAATQRRSRSTSFRW